MAEAFGGGVFEVVRSLCERHIRDGAEVRVAYGVRPETPADPAPELPGGVAVPLPWTERTPAAQAAAHRALRTLTRRWQPDVVHLHSAFAGAVGTSALRGRAPLIYSPHAYSFTMRSEGRMRRRVFLALERYASARADVVGAVSHGEADLARDVARARSVAVIPNGIPDLDRGVQARRSRPGRPLVVAMGRVGPQRQPEACARILARVAELADVAWIGGGGESGGEGYRALERAGIPVSGWLPHSQALERLAEATAYLHWTAWDAAPLSVLEAMARDVLVVATDISATRELLGLRHVCARENQAAELLETVLSEPEARHSLLASQRERATRYSAERMAADWASLYCRLTSGPSLSDPVTVPHA